LRVRVSELGWGVKSGTASKRGGFSKLLGDLQLLCRCCDLAKSDRI